MVEAVPIHVFLSFFTVTGYRYLVIYHEAKDLLFSSTVLECRNRIPEAVVRIPVESDILSSSITFCAQRGTTLIMIGYCFGTLRTFHNISVSQEFGTEY